MFILIGLSTGAREQSIMFFIVPVIMAVGGFLMFKKMVWDLADEVYDEGDYLLFLKSGVEQRIQLKDIINISYSNMANPERIEVSTRSMGVLVFCPPMRLNPFSKSPIAVDLINRVDRARNE